MKNLTNITLMMLIFGAAASKNQCLNLRGQNESCGYLQFCSGTGLHKGCRNCTDIYRQWCDENRDTFRKQYPMCEILCERKMREEAEAELDKLSGKMREAEAELDKLSGEVRSLKLTLWIIGGLFSVGVMAAVVAFTVFRCRRPPNSSNLENGTATPERSGFMEKLRTWFSTICGRGPGQAVPCQQDDPVHTSRPLVPSAPVPDDATSTM